MRRMKKKKTEKLNLIPILDSVFIFIFFLLMSAQFLQIHEIGTDAPAVKTTEQIQDKKPPLNLTVKVKGSSLIILTGLEGKVYKRIKNLAGEYDLESFSQALLDLKSKHQAEETIIFQPEKNVAYKKIIPLLDRARELPPKTADILVKGEDGKKRKTRKLFHQIVFETVI